LEKAVIFLLQLNNKYLPTMTKPMPLQIVKHLSAESVIDSQTDDTLLESSISENTECNLRMQQVIFAALTERANDQLPTEVIHSDNFAINESDSINTHSAPLHKSGWQYSQLIKEFRFDRSL